MTRVLRDYDAVWLTLFAWAIFVLSFSCDVPRYVAIPMRYVAVFTPPLISFAAVIRAIRERRRIDTLIAILGTFSCLFQFMAGVFE